MKKIIFTMVILAMTTASELKACWGWYNNEYRVFSFRVEDQFFLTGYKFIPNTTLCNYDVSDNDDKVVYNEVYRWRDGKLIKKTKLFTSKLKDSFQIFSFPVNEFRYGYFVNHDNRNVDYIRSLLSLEIQSIDFETDGFSLHTNIKSTSLQNSFSVTVRAIDYMGNIEYADMVEQHPVEKSKIEDGIYSDDDDYSKIKDYRATIHNYADYKVVEFLIKDQRGNIVYRKTAFDNQSSTKLYPTMASNLLHIQTDLPNGTVKLTNINGAQGGELYFEQSNGAMDISQLARGMYIANVFANHQLVYTTKIFKQ